MARIKKNKPLTFKGRPALEEEYHELADALVQWANHPDSMNIDGFPLSIMMSPQLFHKLPEDSEYFSQAYDIALHMIGVRREKDALDGFLDKQVVLNTMPLYNPRYKRWLMSLKDKSENKVETKVVVLEIPSFKNCDEVSSSKA